MKIISLLVSISLIVSCASGSQNENTHIGSTPANSVVRSFLGIPLSDSVDFIRWKLTIRSNAYHLQCNYGVGQANTNGFVKGGKKVEISGKYEKEKNYYQFQNGTRILKAVELNTDLLHLVNEDENLMVGNSGWSYTLNSISPSGIAQASIISSPTVFKDSIVFEGRTPCGVWGIVAPESPCYKLKWLVVLYADSKTKNSGTFRISGTPWRQEGGKNGNWKIVTGTKGQTIYQLTHKNGNEFLYLLKLDEHILVFTDGKEKLLVGNEDFSYTLNRR